MTVRTYDDIATKLGRKSDSFNLFSVADGRPNDIINKLLSHA